MNVALTFDDGVSVWTPAMLDALAKHDAKATFFVCGNTLETRENRRTLKLMKGYGHDIGNHTMTHKALPGLSKKETFLELVDCSQRILEVAKVAPKFYRPPYLKDTEVARAVGEAIQMVPVGCDVIAGDWAEPSAQAIAERVVDEVVNDTVNAVVLLHDGRPLTQLPFEDGGSLDSRAHVVEAVKLILPELKDRGFEFVTVSELLSASAVV